MANGDVGSEWKIALASVSELMSHFQEEPVGSRTKSEWGSWDLQIMYYLYNILEFVAFLILINGATAADPRIPYNDLYNYKGFKAVSH